MNSKYGACLTILVDLFFTSAAYAQTFNTPTISGPSGVIQAGTIQRLGAGPLVTGLAYPSGIAQDDSGNLYFGNVTLGPLRVQLMQLWSDGTTLTSLGTVVDTSAGSVPIGGWAFDVAVGPDGSVFYTTPTISGPSGVIQAGTIQRLGAGAVVAGLAYPSGIALDDSGNLYFGNVTFGPLRVQLMQLSSDGTTLTNLGTVVDTSAGSVPVGAWAFDVAVGSDGSVFYNTPTISGPSGIIQAGTIQRLGAGPVVTGLAYPSGIAPDDSGNLYFGNVTFGPIRAQLMQLSSDGSTLTNLGTAVDTSAGWVTIGGWAFDVAAMPTVVALKSIAVSPKSIVGGRNPWNTARTRVELSAPAGAGGVRVTLSATTDPWPAVRIPAPQVVTLDDTVCIPLQPSGCVVTVPAGETFIDVPTYTREVNFPIPVKIFARAGSTVKTATLVVEPIDIPSIGFAADQRVASILNQFVVGPKTLDTFRAALDDIIAVRNITVDGQKIADQDIYLAAADHYLFAAVWTIELGPSGVPLVGGFVPVYELLKLFGLVSGSAPTLLSVKWGEQGVIDGSILLYDPSIYRGSVPGGVQTPTTWQVP